MQTAPQPFAASPPSMGPALPVRRIGVEQPWRWLAAGWRDFLAAPLVSLAYGALFVIGGIALTAALWSLDWLFLALPLGAGFLLVAPVLATGLYAVSRRLGEGGKPSFAEAVTAWRARPGSLAVTGLLLMLLFLVWIRLAFLIFALFFGPQPPSWPLFVDAVFFSTSGIPFLVVGTLVGAVLAAIAFAISAISIPLLLDRDVGAFTAVATSIAAVALNWRVMGGWAALIALFGAAGIATFYLGLAVTLPLIGYATWHAYCDLVPASVAPERR